MSIKGLLKIRKPIFLLCVIAFIATFFLQSQYRFITDIDKKLLKEPIQKELAGPQTLEFNNDGIDYKLTPLYEYEINGLVVSKEVYDAWYSINETDTVFPTDLCLIWGENVETGAYKSPKLRFSQDVRFCFYNWWGENLNINTNQISNNHLVINDPSIKKQVENIKEGDQVQVIGKLVNVDVSEIGTTNLGTWKSSTNREDTYGGACEVIYVEKINVLKQGNAIFRIIHKYSFYGIIFLILFEIIHSFLESRKILEKTDRMGKNMNK